MYYVVQPWGRGDKSSNATINVRAFDAWRMRIRGGTCSQSSVDAFAVFNVVDEQRQPVPPPA